MRSDAKWTRIRWVVAVALSVALASAATAEPKMAAHFINVGQGDATLLEFPCGAVLIDAGGESAETTDRLVAYLDAFFQRRTDLNRTLDVVYVTHPHIDHVRALQRIVEEFAVERYVDNGQVYGSGKHAVKWIRDHGAEHGVTLREVGDEEITNLPQKTGLTDATIDPIDCADCDPQIRILSGQLEYNPGWSLEDYDDSNNHSLVIRVDFGESSFLFSGDLETPAIAILVDWYDGTNLLDVDVYHVGHHGSANGTSWPLIEAMTPLIAVISCGVWNEPKTTYSAWGYGHPRADIVDLLQRHMTRKRTPTIYAKVASGQRNFKSVAVSKAVYATAWDGTVKVTCETDEGFVATRNH